MARLEENETGDAQAAREWLERAVGAPPDPRYMCSRCGADFPEWQSLCSACGSFATLVWKTPAEERAIAGPLRTQAAPRALPIIDVVPDSRPSQSRLAQSPQSDN
jgi:uncharacterized membrane-anchored protein